MIQSKTRKCFKNSINTIFLNLNFLAIIFSFRVYRVITMTRVEASF